MEKPSLHEIAAKPYFGQAAAAIRAHYDPRWGLFKNGEPRTYCVTVLYSLRTEGEEVYEVEASSQEEAEDIALERFYNEAHCDAEVESVEAEVVDD